MPKIVVSAETETWTTRQADPNDEWDRDDTVGRVTGVSAYVDTRDNSYYGDSLARDLDVRPGDTVYAVVVGYTSGDTFGSDGGHAKVMDIFTTRAEAEALCAHLKTYEDKGDFSAEYNGVEYNHPWVGYFELLDSLEVWDASVRNAPADPYRRGFPG